MSLPKRDLYLSHEEYSEMLNNWAKLVRFNPDRARGVDDGAFTAWVMKRFNLEPFYSYSIILEGRL